MSQSKFNAVLVNPVLLTEFFWNENLVADDWLLLQWPVSQILIVRHAILEPEKYFVIISSIADD